jgi:hypothetical protein
MENWEELETVAAKTLLFYDRWTTSWIPSGLPIGEAE